MSKIVVHDKRTMLVATMTKDDKRNAFLIISLTFSDQLTLAYTEISFYIRTSTCTVHSLLAHTLSLYIPKELYSFQFFSCLHFFTPSNGYITVGTLAQLCAFAFY